MAVLDYETYVELGGTLEEEEFERLEPRMESYLSSWTLGRSGDPEAVALCEELGGWGDVQRCAAWLVDQVQGIDDARAAKARGEQVTSFNNGASSFSFAAQSGTSTAAEETARAEALRMLPVEMCSACVSFNEAR